MDESSVESFYSCASAIDFVKRAISLMKPSRPWRANRLLEYGAAEANSRHPGLDIIFDVIQAHTA